MTDKFYHVRPATMQEAHSRPYYSSKLKFLQECHKPVSKDQVIDDPRRQGLWLPFINQLMMLMKVPNFRCQVDLNCDDDKSDFVRSQFFKKFQPIRYTKVCVFPRKIWFETIFFNRVFRTIMDVGIFSLIGFKTNTIQQRLSKLLTLLSTIHIQSRLNQKKILMNGLIMNMMMKNIHHVRFGWQNGNL